MSRAVLVACFLAVAALHGCTTAVDPSPHAGIVRVTLTSDATDNYLVILSDTTQFSRYDSFVAATLNGRIYRGINYAPIYRTPGIERIDADTVNLLAREWLNGVPINIRDSVDITPANSRYRTYVIFELYVPPGSYDSLAFTLIAGEVATYIPKYYVNPIQLPPGAAPQMSFPLSFTVQEDKTTEIEIEISPFKSLKRYQDLFLFNRTMRVAGVRTM